MVALFALNQWVRRTSLEKSPSIVTDPKGWLTVQFHAGEQRYADGPGQHSSKPAGDDRDQKKILPWPGVGTISS
jgi:hypothetical protein